MGKSVIAWKPRSQSRRHPGLRIRCLDPMSVLRAQGMPVELYRPERQSEYALVVLQKPDETELAAALKAQGTRVVMDLCDDPFYNPWDKPQFNARAEVVRRMLEYADLVTVCSAELASRFDHPTAVVRDGIRPPDLMTRLRGGLSRLRRSEHVELVWYGSAATEQAPAGMRDLIQIREPLNELAREFPLRLTVISNSQPIFEECAAALDFPTRYEEWRTYSRFCRRFPRYDICVIPIDQNPYTRCKSNNRLALSLHLGVPVVADPIPTYEEFADSAILGDWYGGLRRYIESPQLRREHVRSGQARIRNNYRIEHSAADWRLVFEHVLGQSAREFAASVPSLAE